MEISTAKLEDLPAIFELANNTFKRSYGFDSSMQIEFPLLFSKENLENLFVVKEKGGVVSHLGILIQKWIILGNEIPVECVGAVCTHPDFRGKGVASILFQEAERKLKNSGVPIMLVSGTGSLYIRLGCRKVGKSFVYSFEKPIIEDRVEIYENPDVDILIEFYQKEPARYFRPKRHWEIFLNIPSILEREAPNSVKSFYSGRPYLFSKDNIPLGYFFLSEREDKFIVSEYCWISLFFFLSALSPFLKKKKIRMYIPDWDKDLLFLLKNISLEEVREMPYDHTIKIINEELFFNAIRNYLEERGISVKKGDLLSNYSIFNFLPIPKPGLNYT